MSKILLSSLIFFSCIIYANNLKPVDEALINKPISDGSNCFVDLSKIKPIINEEIYIENIEKVYKINLDNLKDIQYKCFVNHLNGKSSYIGRSNNSIVNFEVNKTSLSVGDIIVIKTCRKNNFIDNNSSCIHKIIKSIEIIDKNLKVRKLNP